MCGSGRIRAAAMLAPVRIATLRPRPSARSDRVEDYFLEHVNNVHRVATGRHRAAGRQAVAESGGLDTG